MQGPDLIQTPRATSSLNTHGHIHHVSSSPGAGQHGGYTGAGRVVRVHVDGNVRETVSQSADQKLAALWLQQAGHVLDVKMEGNMSVTPGVIKFKGTLRSFWGRHFKSGEKDRHCLIFMCQTNSVFMTE